MPPRKSNVSTTSNGAEDGGEAPPAKATKDGMSVEDVSLPKSMVARLAKGVLPANTSIQKDALLALHKSATVFVNYIASQANENTQAAGKKTIMPPDVMTAMKDAEFESFIPRLEQELKKYNETQCDKRNTYRRKVKEEKAAAAAKDGDNEDSAAKEGSAVEGADGQANAHANDEDAERPFKKFKAQNGAAVAPEADGMDETEETIDNADEDAEDQQEDEDDADEQIEDEPEEAGEDEEEEGEDEDERDDLAAASGVRDEALDDPESDSD